MTFTITSRHVIASLVVVVVGVGAFVGGRASDGGHTIPARVAPTSSVVSTNSQSEYDLFTVPSSSMVPTLQTGDVIVVDERSKDFLPSRKGEIVVFTHPAADTMCGSPGEDLVERVIATGGQTIWSKGNAVYIDGKVIAENYLPHDQPLGSEPIRQQTIPAGEVFVMGDNRPISCDSRYWGPIPTSSVIGKVVLACSASSSRACKSFP